MVRLQTDFLHRCQRACRAAQRQAGLALQGSNTGEEGTREVSDRRVSGINQQCTFACMFPVALPSLVFISVCPIEKGA